MKKLYHHAVFFARFILWQLSNVLATGISLRLCHAIKIVTPYLNFLVGVGDPRSYANMMYLRGLIFLSSLISICLADAWVGPFSSLGLRLTSHMIVALFYSRSISPRLPHLMALSLPSLYRSVPP